MKQILDSHKKILVNSSVWVKFRKLCYENDTTASDELRAFMDQYNIKNKQVKTNERNNAVE